MRQQHPSLTAGSATRDAIGRLRARVRATMERSPAGSGGLLEVLDGNDVERAAAIRDRIETLLRALDSPVDGRPSHELLAALADALTDPTRPLTWLALAVLTGRLPDSPTVQRTVRASRLDGALPALNQALIDAGQLDAGRWQPIEVITGKVLVDLHHTARNLFATGIQRVARETARRWKRDHQALIVGWTEGYANFRLLSAAEIDWALNGAKEKPVEATAQKSTVIVPWRCTHLVAELPVEPIRTQHYQAFVMYAGSTTGLIGHDCVPVMAAETTAEGMSVGFANYLAAAARADRIATTCAAAQLEYRGWRMMLAGSGQTGPDIACIPLPVHADTPTDTAKQQARDLLRIGTLPVVLAVGSHEPRKNHLALLHAAELLWREGLQFTLAFVGGNSWNSAPFDAQVETLRQANRPVQTILGLPDDLLWAAYQQAYCTVFPSLHEGFGLPVAESLASGTPVITSNFGSMRDIARHGGALLIDPRNDQDLTNALRQLLLDPALRDHLAAQATRIPRRSWDDYATDTWAYLVEGRIPRDSCHPEPEV